MSRYGVLVYGGGNCEIAASLQHELLRLGTIEETNIFARGYLFGNSCLSMYRRFHNIKDEIESIKTGGVYEYLRTEDEKVETMELQMRLSCSQEEFESFIYTGLEKVEGEEIILILIGQSNAKGMFIDFLGDQPMYMPYEQLLGIIEKVCKEKKRQIKLILDIPRWHGVTLPYLVSRYSGIDIVYIYERKKALDILPITDYILSIEKEMRYKKFIQGYIIDTHPIWWNICKWKWEEYLSLPSRKKWTDFYKAYIKLVNYNGNKWHHYQTVREEPEIGVVDFRLSREEVKEYFKECCMENLNYEEITNWLQEMKSCTDYYKL